MRRRTFLGAMGCAAVLPDWTLAERNVRIGFLGGTGTGPWDASFVAGLSDFGYVEGRNLSIDWRPYFADVEKGNAMVAELVRLRVDIIVAVSNTAAALAKKATSTIPIIALATHDGVGVGLYQSLMHPGDNVTGIDSVAPELDVKRVGYLKTLVPSLTKLAAVYNPSFSGQEIHLEIISMAAKQFGAEVRRFGAADQNRLQAAFTEIERYRPDAMITVTDPRLFARRTELIGFATGMKLPNAHEYKAYVEVGGLLSYGASLEGMWRRGAYFVDRISKGANPGDLPVELPTVFELAVNRRTASDFGLKIPDSVLAMADIVIE